MDYVFIVNPVAGGGAGKKLATALRNELTAMGVNHNVLLTQGRGHASEIARASDAGTVVGVGGDGTINEVVNGIAGSNRRLGVIPCGSGNDFVKAAGIPLNLRQSLMTITRGVEKLVDLGQVTVPSGPEEHGEIGNSQSRWFVNGLGIGFDAAVAERTSRMRFLSGFWRYVAAVFGTLGQYRSPDFTITLDSTIRKSRNLLIAIGNGTCAGGGFYLTPEAQIDDGLLDVCMIDELTPVGILKLMPHVMKGAHGRFPEVRFSQCRKVSISGDAPFYVHADGEIVGNRVQAVHAEIHPEAVRLLVPGMTGAKA